MEDVKSLYADIAARYTAARKVLAEAKKTHGKKSPEAKAARKAARAIKKERVALVTANPGFTPPPARRGGRNMAAATKNKSPEDLLKLYFELNEVRGFTINEVEKLLKSGQVDDALAGRITPEALRHPTRPATPAPEPAPVPAEAVSEALAIAARVQATVDPVTPTPEPAPAPVAPAAVGGVPDRSLGAVLIGVLAQGHSGTPSQIAALVPAGAWSTTITAKMAADALGRLAKAGKVVKAEGKYSVKG